MNKKLAGKVAIVTGSSKGIGASIARYFADLGAYVAINYSTSKEEAEHVVEAIKHGGGKAIAVQGSMANEKDIKHLFNETKKAFGKIDILVNNAGIYEFASLEEITPENFHKTFDLNVLGLLLACREAVSHFNPSTGGSIVNISSIASTSHLPGTSVYSASKSAVDAITRTLATELGARKIRVNSINPGMVQTEGTEAAGITRSDFRKATEAQTPLGRIGLPQDIAPAAAFLASDESSWITGESLIISGGFH